MNQVPPRCRTDLIELIQRQAPSSVIRRACLTDQVEVLGGFHHALGDTPGWIVKTTSPNGWEHLVAVLCRNHAFETLEIDNVPWHEWAGGAGKSELTNGDHPKKYQELYDAAVKTYSAV